MSNAKKWTPATLEYMLAKVNEGETMQAVADLLMDDPKSPAFGTEFTFNRNDVSARLHYWREKNGQLPKKNEPRLNPRPKPRCFAPVPFTEYEDTPARQQNGEPVRSVVDLHPGMCKYPIGDPLDRKNFAFCGRGAFGPKPYCEEHAARCKAENQGKAPVRLHRRWAA